MNYGDDSGTRPPPSTKDVVTGLRAAVQPHVTDARETMKRQYAGLSFIRSWIMVFALLGVSYLCFSEFVEWRTKWPRIYNEVVARRKPSESLIVAYCDSNMISDEEREARKAEEHCINAKTELGKSIFLEALKELARDEFMQHAGLLASSIEACYNSFLCKYWIVNRFMDWFLTSWAKDVIVPAIGAVFAATILALLTYIYKSMPILRRFPRAGLPSTIFDALASEEDQEGGEGEEPKKRV